MAWVHVTRYPAVDAEDLPAARPPSLADTAVEEVLALPSGRLLSVHTWADPRPAWVRNPQLVHARLGVWRDGACEAVLEGLEDVGFFSYTDHQRQIDLWDAAELDDGSIAVLTWGESEADGLEGLINNTWVWQPGAPGAPTALRGTAWHVVGDELAVWTCSHRRTGATTDLERESFAPEKVVRRYRLHAP